MQHLIHYKGSHTEFKPNEITQTETDETDKSQRLSQKYESGQLFDSSDDENKNTSVMSDSNFHQPGKSKKKHRIHLKSIQDNQSNNSLPERTIPETATTSDSSIFKEHCHIQPDIKIGHPKDQISTIESKITKISKKMHTHIIITPPIESENVKNEVVYLNCFNCEKNIPSYMLDAHWDHCVPLDVYAEHMA